MRCYNEPAKEARNEEKDIYRNTNRVRKRENKRTLRQNQPNSAKRQKGRNKVGTFW